VNQLEANPTTVWFSRRVGTGSVVYFKWSMGAFDMKQIRMTVLGSGAVGLAFAATFAKAGQHVTILARGDGAQQLQNDGITVSGVVGDHHIAPGQLTVSDVAAPRAEDLDCDVLVVSTKAYQVHSALTQLMEHSRAGMAPRNVLLLQNGWGSAAEARGLLPNGVHIFSSIMMIGIERRDHTHVNINVLAGPIRVGTLFTATPDVMKKTVEHGQAGFLPITYEDPVEPAILDKFLFNTCLNAVGAITQMTYGEAVSNDNTARLITQVADETIRVMRAERQVELAPDGACYVAQTLRPFVIPKAAAHRSSMLQDVQAGRRTEIDYLNGAVVRLGQKHGIATPSNDAVSCLIRARESALPQ
jgi:2-dehydropantoate 2-reductase